MYIERGGLRRNLGRRVKVGGRFGTLAEDERGFYLAGIGAGKLVRRVRSLDRLTQYVEGSHGIYLRDYIINLD